MSRIARALPMPARCAAISIAIVAKALGEKRRRIAMPRWKLSPADIERILAAQPDRGAAARSFAYVREENSCGAMRGRWRSLPRSCCCCRARSGFAAWQWKDAERQRAHGRSNGSPSRDAAEEFTSTGAHREHPARTVADVRAA